MVSLRRALAPAALLAAVGLLALIPGGRAANGQSPAADHPELRFVPPDAALFVHVDLARFWGGATGKKLRGANKDAAAALAAQLQQLLGVGPDDVRAVAAFWPRFQTPEDATRLAVVVGFAKPLDKAKVIAAANMLPPGPAGESPPVTLDAPTDRVAVLRVQLKPEDVAEQKSGTTGPLAAALKDAAGGHLAVVGANLGRWADGLRTPEGVPGAADILGGESVTAVLDEGADFTLTLKTTGAARAADGFAKLFPAADAGLRAWAKAAEADGPDPLTADLIAVAKALAAGLKGAKVDADAATVRLPANLPFTGAVASLGQFAYRGVDFGGGSAQSSNNLKQIALAMHNYESANGTFPAAAITDKDGKPLLSWRVSILPYIEQSTLYSQFKMNEPWDSENNKKLIAQMPRIYALPGTSKPGATATYYRVFVGNGAGFDLDKGVKIPSVTDGTSNTLMVATAADPVTWTKPDEIAFDPEQDMNAFLGFKHPAGCYVALFDGSVRRLPKKLDRGTLNGVITRAGGEVVQLP